MSRLFDRNADYYERCATLERNLASAGEKSVAENHLHRAEQCQRMAEAVPLTSKAYERWDAEELGQVKSTLAAGSSLLDLAVALGRTEISLRDKARKIGSPLPLIV